MALPLIFYRSLLRSGGTFTDPGSASGFPLTNLYDYRSYSLWKSSILTTPINIDVDLGGSTETADYIMLVNHNLSTLGATVTVYADSFSPPTTSRGTFDPAEDTVSYKTFTQTASLRYWRVQLSKGGGFASAPYIGECFLGNKTELPSYMAPTLDPFMKQVEVMGSRSQGGHYLGASLRGQAHRGELSFGGAGAARADFTSTLNAFLDDHAYKRRPFGFVLDTADSDFDVCRYLKVPDEAQIGRFAVGGTWQNLTLTLPFEEAYMEPA